MSYEYNDYGSSGRRPGFLSSIPDAVRNLLIINVVIWLVASIPSISNYMLEKFSLFPVESPLFKWWQPLTHMFMHGGFAHIFFNMYSLVFFGSALERMWGTKKFLLFYFVCGLGAAFCHDLVLHLQITSYINADNMAAAYNIMRTPTVGASGAIYGLLLGCGMLFPNTVLQLIFPPVRMKMKWFVIIFGAIELICGIFGGDNVAHFAHLGGMIFGLILVLYWKKKNRLYY
jgi:Uncharacterized membrane protein (homolog of Drosophila rhomboid)